MPYTIEPPYEGAPAPTQDDPTADGYYCGARRSPEQLRQDREDKGIEDPWPFCRNRAGQGTDHLGLARCKHHGGSTRNSRIGARLRMDELVGPSLATLARALTAEEAPWSVRIRAADSILDRAGYPRRLDVDVDQARENLYDRIRALQTSEQAES